MDKRTHHMTDPSPHRLDRERTCAIDRHPPPMHAGKSRAAVAPPPATEQPSADTKAQKR